MNTPATVSTSRVSNGTLITEFIVQTWSYREFLIQSVARDLRTKYKRSALGYLWTVLHPLAMMLILSVVFSHMMRMQVKDYALFLFVALLPWNFFQSTSLMALQSVRANARLFSQVPVPKYLIVVSLAVSNFVNYLISLIPLLLLFIALGHEIHPAILLFPIVVLPVILVTLGVSLLLAASNVFYDDTLHLAEVALQALYFLSPVLYSREMLPDWVLQYVVLNPLFLQIEFLRGIFYAGTVPDPILFAGSLAAALCIFMFGLIIFQRSEKKFMYFL